MGIQDRLINGQTGNIRYIEFVQDSACKLYGMFSKKFIWEIEVPIKKGSRSPCIKYTQFPIILAWKSLVHKVSSLSLEKDVVDFDPWKQKSFGTGQWYTTLSWLQVYQNHYCIGEF